MDKTGNVYNCEENGSPTAESAVYGLNNFIHISITKENLNFYKEYFFTDKDFNPIKDENKNIIEPNEGDVFILVGMHVTTKEIPPWTWMTFWWDPTPDSPELPSTTGMAAGKSILKKDTSNARAVHHYALASGYRWTTYGKSDGDTGFQSVYPAVDAVTGKGIREITLKNGRTLELRNYDAVTVFNPYLEAKFGPDTFDYKIDSYLSYSEPEPHKDPVLYALRFGVETNCTSCHGVASYGVNEQSYNVDKLSTIHELRQNNVTTVDFAWSIAFGGISIDKCKKPGECRPYEKEPIAGGGDVYIYK